MSLVYTDRGITAVPETVDETPEPAGKKRKPVADRTETIPSRKRASSSWGSDEQRSVPVPGVLPTDDPNRYDLAREHARGGLGRILKARDGRLGRTVAVKELIEPTADNEARFVREALITARLQHPGIVPVHEAGRWPSGEPYYVMKLISGESLKQRIKACDSLGDRLSLLPNAIAVAETMAYAHSQGVIHRDIKPSNIVVGEFGETIVVDWGLAKDLRGEGTDADVDPTALSSPELSAGDTADIIGTPAYMPPEQARGIDVDERADVYALGAVLYHMLAGQPPYAGDSSDDIVSRVLSGPPEPVEVLQSSIPNDLVAIVQKAMSRDAEQRYPTAKELADDLKRFQTGKLVTAHDYSTWTLLRRWLERYRAAVAVAAIGVAILVGAGIVAVDRIIGERNVARTERAQAQQAQRSTEERRNALLFNQAQTSIDNDPTAAIAWLKQYPQDGPQFAAMPALVDHAVSLGVARHVFHHDDWVYSAVFAPDNRSVVSASKDGTVWRWDLKTGSGERILDNGAPILAVALSPDGRRLALGDFDGSVVVRDLSAGTQTSLRAHRLGVIDLVFSADGERLVSEARDGTVRVWDLRTAQPVRELSTGTPKGATTLSADGEWYASLTDSGELEVGSIDDKHPRKLAVAGLDRIQRASISSDGKRVIVVGVDGTVGIIRDGGKLERLGQHPGNIEWIEHSPSGRFVATAGSDPAIRIWDVYGGGHKTLEGHSDALYQVEFSPDESMLVSASDDGTARLWNLRTGSSRTLRGHRDDVYRAHFSPDGKLVVTASLDDTVRVWPTQFDDSRVLTGHDAGYVGYIGYAGSDRIVTQAVGEDVRVWDLEAGTSRVVGQPWPGPGYPAWNRVSRARVSPTGKFVGALTEDGNLELFDIEAGQREVIELPSGTRAGTFTPDDSAIVFADGDNTVNRLDLETREVTQLIADVPVYSLEMSPSGEHLALGGPDGVRLWSLERSAVVASIDRRDAGINRLVFSPDGEHIAALTTQGMVMVWSWKTGDLKDFDSDKHHIMTVNFSPDGKLVAGAIADRTVRVWDLETGEVRVLKGHTDLVHNAVFSPDGSLLASCSYDKTIRIWKRGSWQSRVLRGHSASADSCAFTSDGSRLVSMDRDGAVRVWSADLDVTPAPEAVAARLHDITTAEIGQHDRPQSAP